MSGSKPSAISKAFTLPGWLLRWKYGWFGSTWYDIVIRSSISVFSFFFFLEKQFFKIILICKKIYFHLSFCCDFCCDLNWFCIRLNSSSSLTTYIFFLFWISYWASCHFFSLKKNSYAFIKMPISKFKVQIMHMMRLKATPYQLRKILVRTIHRRHVPSVAVSH